MRTSASAVAPEVRLCSRTRKTFRASSLAKVDDLVQSGVKASFHVVSGLNTEPADLIADVAKEADADLIVVGTRGHGRVAGMLLGSVTQRLLHVAPCPVLAVPAKVATKVVVGTS